MHCRVLEENPTANREFAQLANEFIVVYLDTKNGRAPFVTGLKVERNNTYALMLTPNGHEIARMENPRTLEKIILLLKQDKDPRVRPLKARPGESIKTHGASAIGDC
jgi:hypothetical protein